MLLGCQQDGEIRIELLALHECPGTVITVSGRSRLIRILGEPYPNSHMGYECNLRALVSRSQLDVGSRSQFGNIQNVQVGPKSLARECLMRFSVVSVDISEGYLRSVKPFRFKLAKVLQSSISSLKERSRKESGFCVGKGCCIWRYRRTVGYDTGAVRLASMKSRRG